MTAAMIYYCLIKRNRIIGFQVQPEDHLTRNEFSIGQHRKPVLK